MLAEIQGSMPRSESAAAGALAQAQQAMKQIRDLASRGRLKPSTLEPILVALRQATAALADECTTFGQQPPR